MEINDSSLFNKSSKFDTYWKDNHKQKLGAQRLELFFLSSVLLIISYYLLSIHFALGAGFIFCA